MKNRRFLNEKQVSMVYSWPLATLRNWRFLGRGPAYSKIGRSVRYDIADLDEFMEKNRIDPEARRGGK